MLLFAFPASTTVAIAAIVVGAAIAMTHGVLASATAVLTAAPLVLPQVDYEPFLYPCLDGMPCLNLSAVNMSRIARPCMMISLFRRAETRPGHST